MRLKIIGTESGKPRTNARVGKWLGIGAFVFFLIKGLAWLVVPAAVAMLAGANR